MSSAFIVPLTLDFYELIEEAALGSAFTTCLLLLEVGRQRRNRPAKTGASLPAGQKQEGALRYCFSGFVYQPSILQ